MENQEGQDSPNFLKKLISIKNFIIAGFSVLGLVAFIMIILAATVYKGKDPIAMVNGVVIRSLDTSQNEPSVSVDLSLSVRNPSKAIFKSKKATAYLSYRGVRIAKTEFEVGKIAPGVTKPIAFTLTSEAGRLQGSPEINLELKTGQWPLTIETKISGKVPVFRVTKHVVGTQLCAILINVQEKAIMGSKCLF